MRDTPAIDKAKPTALMKSKMKIAAGDSSMSFMLCGIKVNHYDLFMFLVFAYRWRSIIIVHTVTVEKLKLELKSN